MCLTWAAVVDGQSHRRVSAPSRPRGRRCLMVRSSEAVVIKKHGLVWRQNNRGAGPARIVGLPANMPGAFQLRLDRRQLLAIAAAGLAVFARSARGADGPLRFGLTPVFLDSDVQLLAALQRYLENQLLSPVELVKRRTYQEITLLLLSGQLDAAWICGFPFVQYREQLALVAVPLYRGQPLYQSYLIANAANEAKTVEDLRGDVHAFSDPDSNSGFLVTRALLAEMGQSPERFFRHHFFTYGHRNVVRAVASGLADSGSVDGYVFEVVQDLEPDLLQGAHIVRRSEWLGFPPIACQRAAQSSPRIETLRAALLTMPDSAPGQAILEILRLDGFTHAEPSLFDGIAAKYEAVRSAA
jgi:phosphonate transport system substrate-binding protein